MCNLCIFMCIDKKDKMLFRFEKKGSLICLSYAMPNNSTAQNVIDVDNLIEFLQNDQVFPMLFMLIPGVYTRVVNKRLYQRWVWNYVLIQLSLIRQISWYYSDVIMGAMASPIISLTVVYSTVYIGADQRKHQSSASLVLVWWTHRWPVNSPYKWPVTRIMFPFDDVIMGLPQYQRSNPERHG